jgi:hypothetical protein
MLTAVDVLYYFFELQRELLAIRNSLKPEGLFFIELALAETQILRNSGCGALIVGGPGRDLTTCNHLYFFNRKSIRYALEESGFQVEAFLPLPGNPQRNLYKDLVFGSYYLASQLAWHVSAHRLMLGPNFLVVASLRKDRPPY